MRLTSAVFIRCLGGIFLLAFLSAAVQMLGLYGSDGISPVKLLLAPAQGHFGWAHMLNYPSVFWFNCSDDFLIFVPLTGAVFSLLASLGVFAGPSILVSWFLYLSIVTFGQEFMSFQWDILLLETGFLCIFLASWRPLDFLYSFFGTNSFKLSKSAASTTDQDVSVKRKPEIPFWVIENVEPSLALTWLCRWLLFRLMFQSGLCKLESGDEAWRNLTAMTYHYETQPLPTPLGWFAHQLPDPLLLLSTIFVFVLELLLPFLIFAGRRARLLVALGTTFLQVLILLTGNYCFFNLLTIALCLMLLDDQLLCRPKTGAATKVSSDPYRMLIGIGSHFNDVAQTSASKLRLLIVVPVVTLIVVLNLNRTLLTVGGAGVLSETIVAVTEFTQPWHIVSGYGLFAVMTTSRPEISIEGSLDGKNWKEYVFKYKPGPLDRAPPIVAPHQPRLDWQMWFAALGGVMENQWLVNFAEKLLNGSPDVLALLETNPFPSEKPKYIRANVYDYHMTDLNTLFKTGKWWKRDYKGVYLPAVTKTLSM
jgi:lipase maturation factor 1